MKARTAQGGLVTYSPSGHRMVTEAAQKKWKQLYVPYKIMLVIHAHNMCRVNGGWQMNFRVLDEFGQPHTSNFFVGDRNEVAEHHARILKLSRKELKDPERLKEALNRFVGHCIAYTEYRQWIRPMLTSKVLRLDHFIAACESGEKV
jgi:hypothetical protein